MPNQPTNIHSTININHSDLVNGEFINQYYNDHTLQKVLIATLEFMANQQNSGINLPYFEALDSLTWQSKPKELDIYVTDLDEAKQLNNESRGKDYATNILSYPSELPTSILTELPIIPLGELIICHDIMMKEAHEQNKTVSEHITHLLVHGILHLLGFDHELGQAEQDEMEGFEIAILEKLGISNPYLKL